MLLEQLQGAQESNRGVLTFTVDMEHETCTLTVVWNLKHAGSLLCRLT